MHISWTGKKCILCLKESALSSEHLIPDALGGALTCDLICKSCNSDLGNSFEAGARTDPDIQKAALKLQRQLPDELTKRLHESQPVLIEGPGGSRPGKMRKGEPRVNSQEERVSGETSYIQPSDVAVKNVENMMRKDWVGEIPIEAARRRYEEAPNDRKVFLAPGFSVIKWSTEKITLDITNNKNMSPLVPLKIAFEFLAIHAGTAIYDDKQQLRELRAVLRERIEDDPCFKVDRLFASEYRSFHGICFEDNDPYARVQIRLFGHLAFRVHFLRLSISGPRCVYTQSLIHPPADELFCLDDAGVCEC